jgi:hypothetical protein
MVKKTDQTDVEIVEDPNESEEGVIPYAYAVTSYGADYPVDSLVKRIRSDAILVPDFQRKYVWTKTQASRFVESLLLGLPVPGIFLEKEANAQRLLIIDGQQRLLSLYFFYEGTFASTDRVFSMTGVQEQFEGKTYKTLTDEDRRRLDDAIIHATVVRQDEPTDDRGSIYLVFERLNTGGTALSAQEIRTSVYHGEFCDLLKELNDDAAWRGIFGPENKRMKDHELILRFFALLHASADYSRPMKKFLNDFMGAHRHLDVGLSGQALSHEFRSAIQVVLEAIGEKAFRPVSTLNAAVFDSVMVGIARRLEKGAIGDTAAIAQMYRNLLSNPDYAQSYKKSTADEALVKRRIDLAVSAFANAV